MRKEELISMTIAEMLGQSGILTILGMAVVFGFLTIMVFCVSTMGKLFQAREAAAAVAVPVSQAPAAGIALATIAAITAAVLEYRK